MSAAVDERAGLRGVLLARSFRADYLVPRDHPAPEDVRVRLDDALARRMGSALGAALETRFGYRDDSIWLIRRLKVEVTVNAAWDPAQLARAWASQLARAVARALDGGDDGANVLRFPDRAAYLASFLVEITAGTAWSRWYYHDFEGLRQLSVSAAVRTALVRDREIGLAALLLLSARELERVIEHLSTPDVGRVLALFASGPAAEAADAFEIVWSAVRRRRMEEWLQGEEPFSVLRLFLEAVRPHDALAGPALHEAAVALLRLIRRLADSSPARQSLLRRALTHADTVSLYRVVGPADTEALIPLARRPSAWVAEVVDEIAGSVANAGASRPAAVGDPRQTSFGGAFLLLPLLDHLPLDAATQCWPACRDTPPPRLLRFLVLLRSLGHRSARSGFHDALLREIVGIEGDLSALEVAEWQSTVGPHRWAALGDHLALWQRERGAASGERLVLARVHSRGAPTAVLIDCLRGVWLLASGYRPERPAKLLWQVQQRLTTPRPSTAVEDVVPELWVEDSALITPLRLALPTFHAQPLPMIANAEGGQEPTVAGTLARLSRTVEELAFLDPGRPLDLPRYAQLPLAVAAQSVLRDFAWRLAGFARASLPHLHANFLDISASLTEEAERRVVRLARPSLGMILDLSGMSRASYRLGGADERPFTLFPEGAA